MHALIARGKVTARGGHGLKLHALGSCQFHLSADAVAVATVANQLQNQPVVSCRRLVVQNVRRTVVRGNHCVRAAVVVNVAQSHPSPNPRLLENGARVGRNILEFPSCVANQNRWLTVAQIGGGQLHIIHIVSLDD